jgi:hypothetical protein
MLDFQDSTFYGHCRKYLWIIPFSYGLLLFMAGIFLVIYGEPFDVNTYQRITQLPYGQVTSFTAPQIHYVKALVRFTGGNSTIMFGF